MIRLKAQKVCLVLEEKEILVCGAQNIYTCSFTFSGDWKGITPTVVFRTGQTAVSVLLDQQGRCTIPYEVLTEPLQTLQAGVYGTRSGNVVMPTIWADLGVVQPGAVPGETGQEPTADIYTQILAKAAQAEEIAQSVRDDADSGLFDGEKGERGETGRTGQNGAPGAAGVSPHIGENGNWFIGEADTGEPAVETIYKEAEGSLIRIENPYAAPYISELTIFGKSIQDGTPAPDTPVEILSPGDDGEMTVTVCGKNVLDYEKTVSNETKTIIGRAFLIEGVTYTLSAEADESVNGCGLFYASKTSRFCTLADGKGTFVSPVPTGWYELYLFKNAGFNGESIVSAQIESGAAATGHEPYQASTAAIATGLPLFGIPVASGGNVTIGGQQYIADTLEINADGSGTVKKYVARIVLQGDEPMYSIEESNHMTKVIFRPASMTEALAAAYVPSDENGLFSHGPYLHTLSFSTEHCYAYGENVVLFFNSSRFPAVEAEARDYISGQYNQNTPVTVLYELAAPEIIPLTAEEVQAVLSLQTHKPVTSISNDAGAYSRTVYSLSPRGPRGSIGIPAQLLGSETVFQVSESGTEEPGGQWSSTIPTVPQGKYLWTRTTLTFNSGDPVVSCTVSRMGMDGSGSVSSVSGLSPDADGNVELTAENVGALALSGGSMTGAIHMQGQAVTGLNDPAGESDAARKGYVDAKTEQIHGKLATFVRPNLLDNWYFGNPVNQRGSTVYGSGYTVDRWYTNAEVTVTDNGLSVLAGDFRVGLLQHIDPMNLAGLWGRQVTFSFLTGNSVTSGTIAGAENIDAGWKVSQVFLAEPNSIVSKTFTMPEYAYNGFYFSILPNAGTLDVKAVKLELGDTQTLAHQDGSGNWVLNEIPDYGEQLMRCQRYYLYVKWPVSSVIFYNDSVGLATVPIPNNMRITPCVSKLDNYGALVDDAGNAKTVNGIEIQIANNNLLRMILTGTGFIPNTSGVWYDSEFGVSAEL